jgi:peptide/nickel transport system permease protein
MSRRDAARESGDRSDVRPFRERLRDNPRPAVLWIAGALFLFALESGRFVSWLGVLGGGLEYSITTTGTLPGWVGGNIGSAFADASAGVGAIPTDAAESVGQLLGAGAMIVLLSLFAVTVFLSLTSIRVTRLLYPDIPSYRRLSIERALLTAAVTVATVLLVITPVGGIVDVGVGVLASTIDTLSEMLPKITSRDVIPNQGFRSPDGSGWENTFLGLTPAQAWALRTVVVYVYAFAWLAWLWRGYSVFREHYREADWTPRDDSLDRFRGHYWGVLGFAIVFLFVVMAVWAPAVSPVPIEHNTISPCQHEHQFLDDTPNENILFIEGTGEVESVRHCNANTFSQSKGDENVGINSYDPFDRYAPLGTTPRGQDLMTQLAYGARTSLIIGLSGLGLATLIALILSLLSAYYKGVLDLVTIVASDAIATIPLFLLVMLLSVILRDGGHPIAEPLDGGLLLAVVFAFAYWPGLWRSIRGPSLQIAEEDWIDAAESYGQTPSKIMRKHMAPYVVSYTMIYASLLVGGAIIITAALSFLGLGIQPPTPEWGRIIASGRPFITTSSWHISTVSGLMIVFVVTGFNALGDGIRDAIDPESDIGDGDAAATGGGG